MRTRLVERDDAAAMLAIYNPEVIETEISFDLVPRSLEEQVDWISAHQSSHPCLVAVNDVDSVGEKGAFGDRIIGFASVSG